MSGPGEYVPATPARTPIRIGIQFDDDEILKIETSGTRTSPNSETGKTVDGVSDSANANAFASSLSPLENITSVFTLKFVSSAGELADVESSARLEGLPGADISRMLIVTSSKPPAAAGEVNFPPWRNKFTSSTYLVP